jgi:hypothetical protein
VKARSGIVAAVLVLIALEIACSPDQIYPATRPLSPGNGDAALPADLEGKTLVEAATGNRIGEITEVRRLDVVVSVASGFLDMGRREVEIPRNRVIVSRSGHDMKVQTSMTKGEIKDLPDRSTRESGSSSR